MGRSRPIINFRPDTKSIRTLDHLCVWWDQRGVVYYELLKPGETVKAHRYPPNCAVFCVKKGQVVNKDMRSWFFSTTMPHRTSQKWSKTTWRHSTGRCYLIPLIHQTRPLLLIICFHRWLTCSENSTSIRFPHMLFLWYKIRHDYVKENVCCYMK